MGCRRLRKTKNPQELSASVIKCAVFNRDQAVIDREPVESGELAEPVYNPDSVQAGVNQKPLGEIANGLPDEWRIYYC